ncbi:hypothetical protein EYC84_011596 [Monilinia fructicola]|uniref:Uncharacterized protein n=1 Tax=Monilinia fructicola TaxID=38448 RepID=A0A5M9J5I6_MONFR|nr:hypothetical protein EYC84_011596 [Monilinia fructicola]
MNSTRDTQLLAGRYSSQLSSQLVLLLLSEYGYGAIGLVNLVKSVWVNNVSSFDGEAPYIKYPVMFVAGAVAVAQAIPLLASSLWRSASSALGRSQPSNRRFTTRDSFARGRGDYAVVDEDEGELLGDDSDDEV